MLTTIVAVLILHAFVRELKPNVSEIHPAKTTIYSIVWRRFLGYFFTGFLFGLLSLNTKISNLAILPYFVVWSISQMITLNNSIQNSQKTIFSGILLLCCMLTGIVLGHGPWVLVYWISTGRLLPNAWPSATMISNSVFLQRSTNHPWYYYLYILSTISPIHMLGLLQCSIALLGRVLRRVPRLDLDKGMTDYYILFVWPVSYMVGLTCVGIAGGGFQTRFLLPIIPATSLIASIGIVKSVSISPVAIMLISIGAMHLMFYGVMFYPFFCDFEFNVFDVVEIILKSPRIYPDSPDAYNGIFRFMAHYGFNPAVS